MEHPFSSARAVAEPPGHRRADPAERSLLGRIAHVSGGREGQELSRAADEVGLSRMTAGREIRRLQDAIGAATRRVHQDRGPI